MTQSSSGTGSVWNSSFNSCSLPDTPRSPKVAGVHLPPLSAEQEFLHGLPPLRHNDQALAYASPIEEIDPSMGYHAFSNQGVLATDARQEGTPSQDVLATDGRQEETVR